MNRYMLFSFTASFEAPDMTYVSGGDPALKLKQLYTIARREYRFDRRYSEFKTGYICYDKVQQEVVFCMGVPSFEYLLNSLPIIEHFIEIGLF